MNVKIEFVLDVGEQDNTKDAIETAAEEVCNIHSKDIAKMADYEVID